MSCNSSRVANEVAVNSLEPKPSYEDIIVAAEAALKKLKEEFDLPKAEIWAKFLRSLKKYDEDKKSTIFPNISQASTCDDHGHRRISEKLVLYSKNTIAIGSNGTVIFEGSYDSRSVAVKRLLQSHHEVALKEIQNFIKLDDHQNIVRYHGVESDEDFVYLALERCTCNLDDLVQICCADFSQYECVNFDGENWDPSTQPVSVYKEARLESLKNVLGDVSLSIENRGRPSPSPLFLKLMRDIVSGVVHLHELGIIHRDLKPHNVLIIKRGSSLCAKLSDMGISRRLPENMSSLSHHSTGCGTSGWKAPERLLSGRQTCAMDLFSLGCILFFCITHGRHPFSDDHDERDMNIKNNNVNLLWLDDFPEAFDLISRLLKSEPKLRPKAIEVLNHVMLWDSEKRLLFLCEVSNRVGEHFDLYNALERTARASLGTICYGRVVLKWNKKVDGKIIAHSQSFAKDYRFGSVRDLLRLIRNLLTHYGQLPKDIKEIVGPLYEGFDGYFSNLFPKLMIEVYKVVYTYCKEEECFRKYFKGNNTSISH